MDELLLRTDIHRLFDRGYVTITPDYRFEVSRQLKEEWHNGVVYYNLRGSPVRQPTRPEERPDRDLLAWHNEKVFLG
ncbi:MAG TPA: HNH endonuclease [Planctomycetota bacterium]|nr:HNH endonuclease [Planctomycetota bacterium]